MEDKNSISLGGGNKFYSLSNCCFFCDKKKMFDVWKRMFPSLFLFSFCYILVFYSSHVFNNKLLVHNSSHDLNNEPFKEQIGPFEYRTSLFRSPLFSIHIPVIRAWLYLRISKLPMEEPDSDWDCWKFVHRGNWEAWCSQSWTDFHRPTSSQRSRENFLSKFELFRNFWRWHRSVIGEVLWSWMTWLRIQQWTIDWYLKITRLVSYLFQEPMKQFLGFFHSNTS